MSRAVQEEKRPEWNYAAEYAALEKTADRLVDRIHRLRTENAYLWRVIRILAGGGKDDA